MASLDALPVTPVTPGPVSFCMSQHCCHLKPALVQHIPVRHMMTLLHWQHGPLTKRIEFWQQMFHHTRRWLTVTKQCEYVK